MELEGLEQVGKLRLEFILGPTCQLLTLGYSFTSSKALSHENDPFTNSKRLVSFKAESKSTLNFYSEPKFQTSKTLL